MEPVLKFSHVDVSFNGAPPVLNDVCFELHSGEILAIVGESGSGKSTILNAAMGLLPNGGAVTRGDIFFDGKDIPDLSERELRAVRGSGIGMVFQDAGASLCPIRTVGDQIYETLSANGAISRGEAKVKAIDMLSSLGFSDPERVYESYPFELSGGMNQRVGIAIAMLPNPDILLCDEPTSALDVMAQRRVVGEIISLRERLGTAIIIVTHDMAVAKAAADSVLVLERGRVVEYGAAERVLNAPQSDYTAALLTAVPRLRRS